ncbi:MAG: YceD family protein [Candidatus Omnitrophica bacterium]|nr:YceD family protein [Candidatus Omnitrophota bacterium]
MKVNINQIPPEGLLLEETIYPKDLDLDTDVVKFIEPLRVRANIVKITNVVTAEVYLDIKMRTECSRCLKDLNFDFKKEFKVSFPINKFDYEIDIDPAIREEIILDYPIRILCKTDCKGLCPNCGKDLNEGNCSCHL